MLCFGDVRASYLNMVDGHGGPLRRRGRRAREKGVGPAREAAGRWRLWSSPSWPFAFPSATSTMTPRRARSTARTASSSAARGSTSPALSGTRLQAIASPRCNCRRLIPAAVQLLSSAAAGTASPWCSQTAASAVAFSTRQTAHAKVKYFSTPRDDRVREKSGPGDPVGCGGEDRCVLKRAARLRRRKVGRRVVRLERKRRAPMKRRAAPIAPVANRSDVSRARGAGRANGRGQAHRGPSSTAAGSATKSALRLHRVPPSPSSSSPTVVASRSSSPTRSSSPRARRRRRRRRRFRRAEAAWTEREEARPLMEPVAP